MKKKLLNIIICIIMIFAMFHFTVSTAFATDTVTEDYDSDNVNAVVEKINIIGDVTIHSGDRIKEARSAYEKLPDSQKDYVENISILTDAESEIFNLYSEVSNTDHMAIYEATGQYMEGLGTPAVGSVGGEWMVICLTRSGHDCPDGYYENVVDYVKENINDCQQLHKAKSTDNSRIILALTSAGYDVTDIDGHNLLKGLSDMNYLKKQGVNGPIWALIAFDSYAYEIPQNENEETQATREGIISHILEKQLSDGGWSNYGKISDPDMTGMAIQALAPYYNTNPDVEVAVEKALEYLSNIQHENGSFGSIDGTCVESCAQVIVALTALGIDPETDERFVKNGVSVVDAMSIFAVDEGGFEHIPYGGLNGMATEQGQYALVSYFRFLEEKTNLYDMTDVKIFIDENFEDYEDFEDYENFEDYEDFEDYDVNDSANNSGFDVSEDSVSIENDNAEKEEPKVEIEEKELETTEKNIFTENTFIDIKKGDWHYESVKYIYENNLMQGTGDRFEPERKMTRAMLVTVLYRMANPEEKANNHNFADVPKGQWYSDAVAWAASNGIVRGISSTEFAPDNDISREQMALIIYRYAKMQGFDVTNTADISSFTDTDDVSDFALDAIKWTNSVTLVNGTSETTLSPKATATRAQVAAILMRFCENVAK